MLKRNWQEMMLKVERRGKWWSDDLCYAKLHELLWWHDGYRTGGRVISESRGKCRGRGRNRLPPSRGPDMGLIPAPLHHDLRQRQVLNQLSHPINPLLPVLPLLLQIMDISINAIWTGALKDLNCLFFPLVLFFLDFHNITLHISICSNSLSSEGPLLIPQILMFFHFNPLCQ